MLPINLVKNPLSCRYVNIEMNYPRTRGDAETFLWYIYHEKAYVYISVEGGWFLLVPSRCSQLTKGGRCKISKWQLKQCAQHTQPNAAGIKKIARHVFQTEKDFLCYLKKERPALYAKLPLETRKTVER